MANTGNIFPGTGENNAGIGATAWTSPGNILSDNATNASCNAAASSQYLVARNFAFSTVPTNATAITGITVRLEGTESSSGSENILAQIQNASGTLVGSSKSLSLTNGPVVLTYGATNDTWSASPTPAMIHDADFGVRFWFTTAHNVTVDFVTMALEYTVPTHGRSDETDSASALGVKKVVAHGRSDETDSASALTPKKIATHGRADETETASALTIAHVTVTGRADETDTALACVVEIVSDTIEIDVGRADETDTAAALAVIKIAAHGRGDETDTAAALTAAHVTATGRANETDSASALAVIKIAAHGRADETDSAAALAAIKRAATGRADETDSAAALGAVKLVTHGHADEVDSAFSLLDPTIYIATGLAEEADSAAALPAFKLVVVARADETDTAAALTVVEYLAIGLALESDAAFALTVGSGAYDGEMLHALVRPLTEYGAATVAPIGGGQRVLVRPLTARAVAIVLDLD